MGWDPFLISTHIWTLILVLMFHPCHGKANKPLGNEILALIERWPYLRDVLKGYSERRAQFWDIMKYPY